MERGQIWNLKSIQETVEMETIPKDIKKHNLFKETYRKVL